ncbi:Acyl-CoA hydrolase [Enhygromyxa salina]|uniref:Acyl-CoA hydrolase n=1 Tax=Enhygromyxa salina TaxID=215803 RepID=A0A0C2D755_9BACT|nr:acyl-CoA thioesterase [Enhygromyxa salina]KIG15862.1 Acyl-CoA hydrolase [Enhygromyxa salina]
MTTIPDDPHPAIRVCMMPADTNAHGTIFGGKILSLIDQAGAIAAHRLGVGRVVTVAMREVVFSHPVRVGDIVSCYAEVLRVGRTSITVCVRVVAHRPTDTKRSVEVTTAEAVYVSIDETGRAVPIDAGASL